MKHFSDKWNIFHGFCKPWFKFFPFRLKIKRFTVQILYANDVVSKMYIGFCVHTMWFIGCERFAMTSYLRTMIRELFKSIKKH